MTRTAVIIVSLALGVSVVGGAALAKGTGGMAPGPRASFETLDLNGDGEVTRAEIEGQAAARFAAADTNGDGVLSAAELEANATERTKQRVSRMIDRMDANADGALSQEELTAARADFAERHASRATRMFDRLDADGNGAISKAEFDAHASRERADK